MELGGHALRHASGGSRGAGLEHRLHQQRLARSAAYFGDHLRCSWMMLILGRCWTDAKEHSVRRWLVQFGLGICSGLAVMWLDGYRFEEMLRPFESPGEQNETRIFGKFYRDNQRCRCCSAIVGYYGLMFGVLRWSRLTELHRPELFVLQGVVATILWGFLLLFLLPGTAERRRVSPPWSWPRASCNWPVRGRRRS